MKDLKLTENRKLNQAELNYIVANARLSNLDIYRRFPNVADLNLCNFHKEADKVDDRQLNWDAQELMYNGLNSSVAWSASHSMALTMLPIVLMFQRYSPTEFAESIQIKSIVVALYTYLEDSDKGDILPYGLIDEDHKYEVSPLRVIDQVVDYGLKNFAKYFHKFWY